MKNSVLRIVLALISFLVCFGIRAETAHDDRAVAAFERGFMLHTSDTEWTNALPHYVEATRVDDSFAAAWFNQGILYLQTEDWNRAEQAFGRLLQIAPDDYEGLVNRAVALMQLRRWDEAADSLNRALAEKADSSSALHNYVLLGYVSENRQWVAPHALTLTQMRVLPPLRSDDPVLYDSPRSHERGLGAVAVVAPPPDTLPQLAAVEMDLLVDLGPDVPDDWEPPARLTQLDEVVDALWREDLLDELLDLGGVLPLMSEAPVVTEFPDLPSNDPCNPEYWTLPVVMWATSHFATVTGDAIEELPVVDDIPPEPTPESMAGYQRTLLHTITAMRLLCGIPESGDAADTFNALWGPFERHPSTEAHLYFARLNTLLDDYFVLLARIESDLHAARETWQLVGVATAFQDETTARDLLDAGFVIARRLIGYRDHAARIMSRIELLGNPPNPLESQCRARRRHQEAIDNLLHAAEETSRGRWVLVDTAFADEYIDTNAILAEDTSAFYERPEPKGFYRYDYQMIWEHPPSFLEPGEDLIIQGRTIRTSLDAHPFAANIHIPRRPPLHGQQTDRAFMYNVAFRQEGDFFFLLEGLVTREERPDGLHLRLLLEPMIGTEVESWAGAEYTRADANWIGSREYIYIWDETGRRHPLDPDRSQWADYVEAEEEIARARENDPPRLTPEEIASAVEHHQSVIVFIQGSIERTHAELLTETDPDRQRQLREILTMHLTNLQIEHDQITSLETGVTVRNTTPWEVQTRERFMEQVQQSVFYNSRESILMARMPLLAGRREADSYAARAELHQRMSAISQSGDPIEERVAQLEQLRVDLYGEIISEARVAYDHMITAENRLWYAEMVPTACRYALLFGALFVPGGAYVSMSYGVGIGYVEGGTFKAFENGIRSLLAPVDVAWAGYDGYYAQHLDPDTGMLVYGGWEGAARNAAITFAMNKAFEHAGRYLQGQGNNAASANRLRRIRERPLRPGTTQPRFDAFQDPSTVYRANVDRINTSYSRQVPRNPDGSINVRHPNFNTVRQRHNSMRQQVDAEFGVIAQRERMATELRAATARHEARIPQTARNADGTVNTAHPDYRRVHGEWQGEMNSIRSRHNQGYEARMNEQFLIISDHNLQGSVCLSGGRPKSIMSDIDLTASDMNSGQTFVRAMRDRGYQVSEYPDRWVIRGADTVVWKPQASPETPGSAAHQASVMWGTERGSDKFSTEGGVFYTTQGAAGVNDPAGAVIANLKKATESGLGGTSNPDFHVVGKSVDKAVGIANQHGAQLHDPVFMRKASDVRAHRTPEEAGLVTFGNSAAQKQRESAAFLDQAQDFMAQSMRTSQQASQRINAERAQAIHQAERAGDWTEARRLRNEQVRANLSNDAAMQALSLQDPALIQRMNQARGIHPPSPPPPPPPPPVAPRGFERGYGWMLQQLGITADPSSVPAPLTASPTTPDLHIAHATLNQTILPAVPTTSPDRVYFAALNEAFRQAPNNPVYATRAVQALSGYSPGKVVADLNRAARAIQDRPPVVEAVELPDNQPLRDPVLASTRHIWFFARIPSTEASRENIGLSDEQVTTRDLAPRITLNDGTYHWNNSTVSLTQWIGRADGRDHMLSNPTELDNFNYSVTKNLTCHFSVDGERILQLEYTEVGRQIRPSAVEISTDLTFVNLPHVETRTIQGEDPVTLRVYTAKDAEMRSRVAHFDRRTEWSHSHGRGQSRTSTLRWDETENTPLAVVIVSTHALDALNEEEREDVEQWLESHHGW